MSPPCHGTTVNLTPRSPQKTSVGTSTKKRVTSDGESAKRQSSISPKIIIKVEDTETVGLKCAISTLKSAIYEASLVGSASGDMHLHGLLKQISKILEDLLSKRKDGDIRPATKKPKTVSEDTNKKTTMVDQETEMDLTPHWWESKDTREADENY